MVHASRLKRFGRPGNDGIFIGIALKREEIAEMAGITAESAIRMLGAMRNEKIIAIEGRTITLLNSDRLARIAREPGNQMSKRFYALSQ
jgi:CRP/FNR family transcriptional regulator